MIEALITFMVVVLVVAFCYWVVTKVIAASKIDLPPIIMVVVQIIFALVILLALINLLMSAVGGGTWGGWPSLEPRRR